MRSALVVIRNVFSHDTEQMFLTKDDDMVETLSADGADHPTAIRILPGRMRRNEHFFDVHHLGFSAEAISVDPVPVANQEACFGIVWKRLHDLLSGPLGRRILGRVEMDDSSAAVREDYEAEEEPESHGRDNKEIAGVRHVHMVF